MSQIISRPQASEQEFKAKNRDMFDGIAPTYDFLNHFLSLGIDILWRKKAVSFLRKSEPNLILDIATGTGDLAIEASTIKSCTIKGIDVSQKMLAIGIDKIKKKKLSNRIDLIEGDSENIPFAENMFDAACVGFGVRNFANLKKGISEINRVLKPGGQFVILEFTKPSKFPIKQLYSLYFSKILPFTGRIFSGHNEAYTYLHDSVQQFPDNLSFKNLLLECGFTDIQIEPLSFGIASIFVCTKRRNS